MAGPTGKAFSAITIVSGLPRSGTSLMMQVLEAAGLPIASDAGRAPDEDNPRGYLELSAVRRIHRDTAFLREAVGRVVKVVAPLLEALPDEHVYRILFMQRDLDEVLASQRSMLERRGESAAPQHDAAMRQAFASELARVERWLAEHPRIRVLFVAHRNLIERPEQEIAAVADFLVETGTSIPIDARAKMAAVVEPALHRQHSEHLVPAPRIAAAVRSGGIA
jgi:hypothetical protein